jgi:S-adenosylmethionine hydrolase
VDLHVPKPSHADGRLETHILYVDTFGNVKLTALATDLRAGFPELAPGTPLQATFGQGTRTIAWRTTFGDAGVGEPLLYEDSYGRLCLAVNQGDAATTLSLEEDMPLTIERS